MSTTIDAAESVVRDLQGKHAAAIARQAELAAERQAIAFAAHTGDADARATLTALNAEDAVLTGEVTSLLAAIDEAKLRAAAAHRQAVIAARHARAHEAQKRAKTFRRHAAALDASARDFRAKYDDLAHHRHGSRRRQPLPHHDHRADRRIAGAGRAGLCPVPLGDFLWATVPMLRQALEVMRAWGFEYRTEYAWVKPGPGLGYWSHRDQLEHLLVGIRGAIPAPAPGTQPPQVMTLPRGEHSAKPAEFAAMIESLFPHVPRLEMFARAPRPDWDVWGNEVDSTSW